MKTNKLYKKDYNSYQPTLPVDFTVSYNIDIPKNNISKIVKSIVEWINLAKYINFLAKILPIMIFKSYIFEKRRI